MESTTSQNPSDARIQELEARVVRLEEQVEQLLEKAKTDEQKNQKSVYGYMAERAAKK